MALTLVLSVGLDSELSGIRNRVLQSAGYTVVRAFSLMEAMDCFQTLDFDLVILCQSIPAKEKIRLTSWIRGSGSRIPVVSVSEKPCQEDDFAGVTVVSKPDALLLGLRKALRNPPIPEAGSAAFRAKEAMAAATRNELPGSSVDRGGQRTAARIPVFAEESAASWT